MNLTEKNKAHISGEMMKTKRLPVKMTPKMCNAGLDVLAKPRSTMWEIYEAILDAAPPTEFPELACYREAGKELPDIDQFDFEPSDVPKEVLEYISKLRIFAIAKQAECEELKRKNAKIVDSTADKIMNMTDEQIFALCRLDGHDPKDEVTIIKMTSKLAILKAKLTEAEQVAADEALERADQICKEHAKKNIEQSIVDKQRGDTTASLWSEAMADGNKEDINAIRALIGQPKKSKA